MKQDSAYAGITPSDIGLPAKFDSFRNIQCEALDWMLTGEASEAVVTAACLPTGSGKTAFAVALAKLLGGRAAYLTATKALQSQVMQDFSSIGMVDVYGRSNYTCPVYGDCDTGIDSECSMRNTSGCARSCAVEAAKGSSIFATNYANWLYSRRASNNAFEHDDRPITLLICDEAANIPQQIAGFANVKVYSREIRTGDLHAARDGTMQPADGGAAGEQYHIDRQGAILWRAWAKANIARLSDSTDDDDKDLVDRSKRIARMSGNWVWQFDDHGHCTFEPVHIAPFTHGLFSGVPRVLLMSASLDPFTCRLILGSDIPFAYRSWQSTFPPQHAPLYLMPTRKLTWKSSEEDYAAIIAQADEIVDRRLDRKGIVHTVSYARTRRILQHSRHAHRFIWNDGGDKLQDSMERFRSAGPGTLLVSPSIEEGHSFEGDIYGVGYQIILKFPFPNETQRVIRERCRQIPGYRLHYAAQKIVQMKGRPIRSPNDKAECFILDSAASQLNSLEGRSYVPPGFRMYTVTKVPPAPPNRTL